MGEAPERIIGKFWSIIGTGLIRWIQVGVLYIRYRSSTAIMIAELHKVFTDETLHYSIVKATPGVPLTFLKVQKPNVKP